jgi:hypothetical protein
MTYPLYTPPLKGVFPWTQALSRVSPAVSRLIGALVEEETSLEPVIVWGDKGCAIDVYDR